MTERPDSAGAPTGTVTPDPLAPAMLNDGTMLPAVGLGTFRPLGPPGVAAVVTGPAAGYRLLDTAVGYGSEPEVGEALRQSPVPREQVRVTTKLRGPDHAYDRARRSIRESRLVLGGAPVDLYLIHWPGPRQGRYVEAWRALVDARADGDVVSIGVANFERPHLDAILDATGVAPAVNQVELHPHFAQTELRRLDTSLGIRTQSWSPLGLGQALDDPVVTAIASSHRVLPAQVVLRWHHQLGCTPVPRSTHPGRQKQNLDLAGFVLSDDELGQITALGQPGAPRYGRLWGGDPATQER